MHVHLVFVTKYRRNVFSKKILNELRMIFASVCIDFEAELVEFNGEDDHVHLLVNYPPKTAISKLVNSPKGVSSHLIRKKDYFSIRQYIEQVMEGVVCRTSPMLLQRNGDPLKFKLKCKDMASVNLEEIVCSSSLS